ncbi:4-hydroxy-3-methylbut-2-enyl diphosphate reductase [Saccharomonospora sp. NPDC046836]|uniref:4-hydroxy-3-methylbut-2-enyl diphosphate reductase n=1 Tax=Saccharomonospora sp. NPDC046836 TaxID=3156921 RepID=UPI00340EFA39
MNTPVSPGSVLVADRLLIPGQPSIVCHAAQAVTGDLHRRGITPVSGPVRVPDDTDRDRPPPLSFTAVLPGTGGQVGLGLSATAHDPDGHAIAATTLATWLAVVRPRTLLLASPRSFCAGVERAIEIVERLLDQRNGPIYVRKEIVHNAHVIAGLRATGAVFVDELDTVPDGATVVFSAHGVSPAVRAEAARRGLEVIDATCPLVTKVHTEARRFAERGDTVVLIGHAGHEEVEGTLGEAPEHTVLVENVDDVANLVVQDPQRVSYLTQTTLAVDDTTEVIEALRTRFPALRGPGTADICYATTNRQDALKAIAGEADLVLVIGSMNSSNSQRLVELAHRAGTPAHLINDASNIRPEWLADAGVIALTAGASAPAHLVESVITTLGGLGPVTVVERATSTETMRFTLPITVRQP